MRYKRVVVSRLGGPEVLQSVEEELPAPRHGEVRVQTLAAGVWCRVASPAWQLYMQRIRTAQRH